MGMGSRPHQKAFFLQGLGPTALVPCEVPKSWKTARALVPGSLEQDLGSPAAARNVNVAVCFRNRLWRAAVTWGLGRPGREAAAKRAREKGIPPKCGGDRDSGSGTRVTGAPRLLCDLKILASPL